MDFYCGFLDFDHYRVQYCGKTGCEGNKTTSFHCTQTRLRVRLFWLNKLI